MPLKVLFGRIRPDFDEGGARLESLSYPSGHASGIAGLVAVGADPRLAGPLRRAPGGCGWSWAWPQVVLVGFTRMWLGVHDPSDVVGGWALGIAWSLAVALVFEALPGGRGALPDRDVRPVAAEDSR